MVFVIFRLYRLHCDVLYKRSSIKKNMGEYQNLMVKYRGWGRGSLLKKTNEESMDPSLFQSN